MKRIIHVPVILLASLLLVSVPSRLWSVAPRVTKTTKTMKNNEYIEKYAAFAQEQMIKYGIPDIRWLYENDLRFLSQLA